MQIKRRYDTLIMSVTAVGKRAKYQSLQRRWLQ